MRERHTKHRMKNTIHALLIALASITLFVQAPALHAGGGISSGGTPPSDFVIRRMQIQAILNDPAVQERFSPDAIESIRFVEFVPIVGIWRFALASEKCEARAEVAHKVVYNEGLPSLLIQVQLGACK
jgi:hypothetical protein